MAQLSVRDRFKKAWNAFTAKDAEPSVEFTNPAIMGMSSSVRMDRKHLRMGTERTIIASIYNRIALDVASVSIVHARVDQNGNYLSRINSRMGDCFGLSANLDQTSAMFIKDLVLSMFDEGVVAMVPVDTDIDITQSDSFDILSLRTGRITQWMPSHVRVEVYNERTGKHEELTLPKASVGIVENPFYDVMNEPNSSLQRLRYKLSLLDATDDKQNSEKLNLIIQLPYSLKSTSKRNQAEERRKEIEMQLVDSKYGIAYIDSTEKVTQLGHSIENKLLEQIEYLTNQVYAQLGMPVEVFNGTANQETMLNYYNRTLEPILNAITGEARRKFLTKTARTQGQSILYFMDPFKLVPVDQLADSAEKLTRNEILSSNEVRGILGYQPSDKQRADDLVNKNINPIADDPNNQNGNQMSLQSDLADLKQFDAELSSLEAQLRG